MIDLIGKHALKRVMKILALIAIGIVFGYAYRMIQISYGECMATVHPAGWVEDNEGILAAKKKMGPMYGYMIKDRILFVDRGDGRWLRLDYER